MAMAADDQTNTANYFFTLNTSGAICCALMISSAMTVAVNDIY